MAVVLEAIKTPSGGPRWLAFCDADERNVPADAGFRWHAKAEGAGVWWSESRPVAQRLEAYAKPSAMAAFKHAAAKEAGSYAHCEPTKTNIVEHCTRWAQDNVKPYQTIGIDWLLSEKRTVLGDDMGLGKTGQACIAAAVAVADDPCAQIIVCCPTNVTLQWVRQFELWCGITSSAIVDTQTEKWPWTQVVIIGYGAISAGLRHIILSEQGCRVLIADEAHQLRGMDSKRSQAVLGIKSDYCWLLTGTPIPNRPIDLYPLLAATKPTLYDFATYEKRFCDPREGQFGREAKGATNLDELYAALRSSGFLLRRLKKDVLPQLPPKTRNIVVLPAGASAAGESTQLIAQGITRAEIEAAVMVGSHKGLGPALEPIRIASSLERVPRLVEYIACQAEAGRRPLVLCIHPAVAESLARALDFACVHGALTRDRRVVEVDRYTRGELKGLVGTLGTIGTGVDGLQAVCAYVVVVEFPWSPGDLYQGEDRVYRMGQNNPVEIDYLVEAESLETSIAFVCARKAEQIESALDGRTT